ncbi:piggyBac transposable element-derived protein 3-like isoform X1 [Spodoptera litura]|uniref:PiggyBac transposable element-derived protein 3-like isoform X1 n=1 Tax=Spodoptera litura TaxID=69820 RepID=A0A9J7E334_SPOLT|nr:piggyBac transposable element-derived protein 3-like isoform X1 [Spodoptera litura]
MPKAWRSKKILALLPPPDSEGSELESEDDDERRIVAREYFRNDFSCSSSVRSISSEMYDLLQDLSDLDEPEPESGTQSGKDNPLVNQNESLPSTSSSSSFVARPQNLPPCFVPPTPSTNSVTSPLTPSSATTRRRTRQIANIESSSSMLLPSTEPAVKKRKLKQLGFTFKKTKYTGTVEVDTRVTFAEQFEVKTPQQYFKKFFSDELLDYIVDMTNLYSVQDQGKSINVTKKEIEIVLGIVIIMGIVKMPAIEDYWSNDLRFEPIASAMGIKRYRTIKRFLHFCDNTNVDKNDGYHKVSAVMEHVHQQCLKLEEERSFAIDEMIIPYKGKKAGNRKQYNPKKTPQMGF